MIKNGRIRVKAIEFRLLENRECPDLGCQATHIYYQLGDQG
jgi:hypothetical protein